jgi:hypothetical protein
MLRANELGWFCVPPEINGPGAGDRRVNFRSKNHFFGLKQIDPVHPF